MPVALEKMPVISGGSVDVSRPNDSGLHQLATSLDVAVRSAAEIGQVAQANELNRINSLMNDATAGPDEIREIAESAFFPLNKYAAKNRVGEAVVSLNRTAIEEDLANAKDPVHAREMLRQHQQDLLGQVQDPAEAVGVREAVADMAPQLLNEASRRRQIAVNLEKRKAEGIIFNDSLKLSADNFAASVVKSTYDQTLADPTKVHEVHDGAAQSLLNAMIEDPAMVPRAKAAAYAAIEALDLDPQDRAKYTAVIQTARTFENQANSATANSKAQQAAYDSAERDFIGEVYGGKIKPETIARMRRLTTDPIGTETKIMNFLDKVNERDTGIAGSNLADEVRKRLIKTLEVDIAGMTPPEDMAQEMLTDSLQEFDFLTERIPRQLLRDDPYEARKQIIAIHDTIREHNKHRQAELQAFQEAQKTARNNLVLITDKLMVEAEKAKDFKKLDELEQDAIKLETQLKVREFDAMMMELYQDALEKGIPLTEFRH